MQGNHRKEKENQGGRKEKENAKTRKWECEALLMTASAPGVAGTHLFPGLKSSKDSLCKQQ